MGPMNQLEVLEKVLEKVLAYLKKDKKVNFLEKLNNFYKDIENHKKIDNFLQSTIIRGGSLKDLRNNKESTNTWNKQYNNSRYYTIFDSIYEKEFILDGKSKNIQTFIENNVYINTCTRIEDENSRKVFNLKKFTMISIPLQQNSINSIFNLFNKCFDKKLDLNNIFYIGDSSQDIDNLYYLENNCWSYPGNNTILPEELRKPLNLTTIYYQLGGSKKKRDKTFTGITKHKLESLNDSDFIEIGEFSDVAKCVVFGLERLIFASIN